MLFEFLSKFTSDDKLIDIVFTSIQHAEKYYSICDRSIASDLMHNLKLWRDIDKKNLDKLVSIVNMIFRVSRYSAEDLARFRNNKKQWGFLRFNAIAMGI